MQENLEGTEQLIKELDTEYNKEEEDIKSVLEYSLLTVEFDDYEYMSKNMG